MMHPLPHDDLSARRPRRVLVLGSGGLQIGQAGEFDYSGSQALKALREEGVATVLLNPNVATVQTSEGMADTVYFLPVEPYFVEQVIIQEQIDALMLSFGGQTALNCGLALAASGALARHGVRVLGTPVETIRATEDRSLFAARLAKIGVPTPRSRAATTLAEAQAAASEIGFPLMLRAGFALGGKGSAMVRCAEELAEAVERALVGSPQVLVEEYLGGWKEIEYEVLRDRYDNCIAVCNMENVDPLGIHTGESIVVAPSQTLNDEEYQHLRDVALNTIRHLGIVGECNIQYALDPHSNEYRVIEVNARLSRSSALASKATGYPLAYVAAKLSLGYALHQLTNSITRSTTAFFEPALDYIVCKVPRWDLEKFDGADPGIGPEMKSVGEVMAIGRSFPEALQKALRMLEIGVDGLDPEAGGDADLVSALSRPTPRRILAIARAFAAGMTCDEVAALTAIDRFFLAEIARVVAAGRSLAACGLEGLDRSTLAAAKRDGFSDRAIARAAGVTEETVRARRHALGVRPRLLQIDTLAAEYPAETNYLYLTYAAAAADLVPSPRRKVLVLGSGCYRIGSSVEFDWSGVHAAAAARELGYETIFLNCNPETVSTDYDAADLLVFDEISLETILELNDQLAPAGVLVAMGGQTPNRLALDLHGTGVHLLGTSAASIDRAEDRGKFSALCDELGIDQPRWTKVTKLDDLDQAVEAIGGFPVLVRPSYVLSGAAMRVAHSVKTLRGYLARAAEVSPSHPLVLTSFESNATELEYDAVAAGGIIILQAISEHIEAAGVHSGDATMVLPPQDIAPAIETNVGWIAARLAQALQITGPFNLQLLVRGEAIKVIECNLRASRSFPFVSKVLGVNFIRAAAHLMLGGVVPPLGDGRPDYVAVKAPLFSYRRLPGVDPLPGVEMAATGEVACFGDDADEALLKAMLAAGFRYPQRGVYLEVEPAAANGHLALTAAALSQRGLTLYAPAATAAHLARRHIPCRPLPAEDGPPALELLRTGAIDLVVCIPGHYASKSAGFIVRRAAIDWEIPLVTEWRLAHKLAQAMARYRPEDLSIKAWHCYVRGQPPVRHAPSEAVPHS